MIIPNIENKLINIKYDAEFFCKNDTLEIL